MKIIFTLIIWDISYHYHYQHHQTDQHHLFDQLWLVQVALWIFITSILCAVTQVCLMYSVVMLNHRYHLNLQYSSIQPPNYCKAWMFFLGLPIGSKVLKWSKSNCCSSCNSMIVQATIFRGPWVPRDCVTALSLLPSPPFPKATDGLANLGNWSFSPPVFFSGPIFEVVSTSPVKRNVMECMSIGFPLGKIVVTNSGSDQAFRIERQVCHISQFLSWKGGKLREGRVSWVCESRTEPRTRATPYFTFTACSSS